jgi:hypothetical protein
MALSIESFSVDNIIFEDVKKVAFGDIKYQRIPIKYNGDGGKYDLCIATPELMSWGVQENRQKQGADSTADKPIDSYSLPLIMADESIVGVFEEILYKCQEHLKLESTRKAVGRKMDAHADEMDIFYRKKDGDVPVAGAPPTMYPKLFTVYEKIRGQTPPKISTLFYDVNDDEIDPIELVGVRCKVMAAIVVKDIYIGAKPSIQLKVNDVTVLEKTRQQKRLLAPISSVKPISVFKQNEAEAEVSDEVETKVETKVELPKPTKFVMRKRPT